MNSTVFDRHLHLRFSPSLVERVQEAAATKEQTMSELIRAAVREYLNTLEQVTA
ncbi:ribbon-helix-helix domain-containing protein [Sneathiella marina]|uniref:Ribbon-helix-helix domain-containing protein n=1 Tax=Sneathiella marina TaxID=2950108 RepID=A0ABY4W347_9PROT|nr:ribbon-helix-helix domain-containing protein [Sneathiella marina]USG61473.1 ribbon-helix-helix domain-containing protein [Sneathiella marina]